MTLTRRRPPAPEDGLVLTTTVFLGAIALVILAFIIARGIASSEVAGNELDWEVALNVAEGELDAYIADLFTQDDPDAVTTGHLVADLGSRAAVVAEAELLATVQPGAVIDAPGGEVVIIKPSDDPVVFAVGFVPDIATVGHKVRVVSARYDTATTTISDISLEYGVWGGEDVVLEGSTSIVSSGGAPPNVHANGSLSQGSATRIDGGCGTESVDSGYTQPGCPPSPVAALPVPQIAAVDYHHLAWYDLCPDGAHLAPNHPTDPGGLAGVPCSGPLTAMPAGWSGGGASWAVNGAVTGIFLVSGADITGKPASGTVATLIAHRTYDTGETPGTCGQGTGGSVLLRPGSSLVGHPATGSPPIAVIADGDVDLPNSDVVGLVAAGETYEGSGAGSTLIEGAIVVEDRCDEGLTLRGNTTIAYTGPFATLFEATTTTGGTDTYDIALRSEI